MQTLDLEQMEDRDLLRLRDTIQAILNSRNSPRREPKFVVVTFCPNNMRKHYSVGEKLEVIERGNECGERWIKVAGKPRYANVYPADWVVEAI